jgi:hypothetical protein
MPLAAAIPQSRTPLTTPDKNPIFFIMLTPFLYPSV